MQSRGGEGRDDLGARAFAPPSRKNPLPPAGIPRFRGPVHIQSGASRSWVRCEGSSMVKRQCPRPSRLPAA